MIKIILISAIKLSTKRLLICTDTISEMRIFTGKGSRSKNMEDPYKANKLSILKYSVPEFIQNNADLIKMIKKIDIDDINNRSSGHFSIYLKTKKNENRY